MSTWYGCHGTQRENKQRLRWNYAVILVCTYTTIGWIIHPMILLSVNYSPDDSGQTASYPSVTHMTKWVNDGWHIFQHRQVDFWDTFYGKLKQKTNDILWWNGWRSIDNWCTEIIALLLMRRKNTKSQADKILSQWYERSSIKIRKNWCCFSRDCGTQMRKDENVEQLLRFKEDRYKCWSSNAWIIQWQNVTCDN